MQPTHSCLRSVADSGLLQLTDRRWPSVTVSGSMQPTHSRLRSVADSGLLQLTDRCWPTLTDSGSLLLTDSHMSSVTDSGFPLIHHLVVLVPWLHLRSR